MSCVQGHLVSDEDARKRFEREAKAAVTLNHPTIYHVYGIDEVEGKGEALLMNNFTSIFTCLLTTTIICLFGNEAMAAGKTCRDESCFAGQVADCNAGSNYTSPVIVEAQVRYSILGPHGRGCEVDMVYTRHSNPEWVHKPLLFTIDPDGDIDAQIKSAVTGCLEGKGA